MICVMKKMMVLTLALSVMMVGNAMAMSGAHAEVRGPGRVKIDVNIAGKHDGRYVDVLHLAFCPACRARLSHEFVACDHHHRELHKGIHKPHRGVHKGHPKHRHDGKHGGKDDKHKGDRGHGRGNDKGHGRK